MVKLGDVCLMNSGGTPSRSEASYYSGNIPWAKISDMENTGSSIITQTEEWITESGLKAIGNKTFPTGTLLLAMYGASVGKMAFAGTEISANQAILGIRAKNKDIIDQHYLGYWFKSIKEKLVGKAVGGAQPNISLGIVKDLQIPLPPLATQKRIAAILDAADALRRKDQALLQKYDELAQAIFVDMFGDPVKNEKGWEVKTLKEICAKITDGTHFSPPNVDSGIPYITAKHLKKDGVNFYSNPTYISQVDHREIYARCNPVKGDVLYIKDGATTGIAAVNEYDFEFSMLSSLALIKPDPRLLNSYFLVSYLNNEDVKQELIREYMAGAAIKRFTLDKMKKFKIPVPPIELQYSYELKWKKLNQSIHALKNSKSNHLFQSLLQKAFNAELVP